MKIISQLIAGRTTQMQEEERTRLSDELTYLVQKAYKNSTDQVPLREMMIKTEYILPTNTEIVPFDPHEEIGLHNWRERGALRNHFAKIKNDSANRKPPGKRKQQKEPDYRNLKPPKRRRRKR